jgi:hypothetical protein
VRDRAQDLDWCRETEAQLGAYYHGSLKDPVAFPDREGARRGYEDALMEECLLRLEQQNGYEEFLSRKVQHGSPHGFTPLWLPDFLFDFQSLLVEWSLIIGRGAIFADCGMGKTPMELVWAENVIRKTNKPVLILTPLAVGQQTMREAEKFGIEARRSSGAIFKGINITNYEKLHLFRPDDFAGVVCDESSAIKAFDGKRRAQVTEFLRTIPYRLMATATAAPNDYIELGTTSEALGVMGQVDMLNRFFKNDNNTSDTAKHWRGFHAPRQLIGPGWRFKGHAEIPFWRWVCSWARAGRRPSDFGPFSDDKFKLLPLIEHEHIVETRTLADGMLFALPATNMQEEREESRRTIPERCEMAATLVESTEKPFIIWCNLNPEGDLLERLIPDAVQISGADPDEAKEEKYATFLSGQSRGMISKQKIGGWGLNCQHCAHVVEFATHSFEAHYQGVRRCWRFGQKHPVINDIIATEGQRGIMENLRRKTDQADRMFDAIVKYMAEALQIHHGYKFEKKAEVPAWL